VEAEKRQQFFYLNSHEMAQVRHINIQCLRRALFHRWLCADDIRFFKPRAMLFGLGARLLLMFAFTAGQCIDLSRSAYPKSIG
jgi:hypothetical protein